MLRRYLGLTLLLAGGLAAGSTAWAQSAPPGPRTYSTRRTEHPPQLDGRPDEACWNIVEWSTDFVQWEPAEGQPPTCETAFKILYDDQSLYIAYRCHDPEPQRIESQLARRDRFPGDWVEINIDSYFDHRTAYSFTSSVSGTRGDEFVSDDGENWDGSWDPIWTLATSIDAEGWTAEVEIPLSQLRFVDKQEQVWGIQVQRRLFRKEERSLWQPKTKSERGWVSSFGELRGISGVRPARQVELLPYAVARGETFEPVANDPFHDGSDMALDAGLDGKVGVSSNLTLDFTVNPDFGQVEADPSEVNLTAFETQFSEKRPFFIEGNSILDFQVAPGGHRRRVHVRQSVLLAAHRAAAARQSGRGGGRVRGCARRDVHPAREQAHRADGARAVGGLAGERHRRGNGAHRRDRHPGARGKRGAAHQLPRRAHAARLARRRHALRRDAHLGAPPARRHRSRLPAELRVDRRAGLLPRVAEPRLVRGGERRREPGGWQHRCAARDPNCLGALLPAPRQRPRRGGFGAHRACRPCRNAEARQDRRQVLQVRNRRHLALARVRDQRHRIHAPRRRGHPVRLGPVLDSQSLQHLQEFLLQHQRVAAVGFRRREPAAAGKRQLQSRIQEQLAGGCWGDAGLAAPLQLGIAWRSVHDPARTVVELVLDQLGLPQAGHPGGRAATSPTATRGAGASAIGGWTSAGGRATRWPSPSSRPIRAISTNCST